MLNFIDPCARLNLGEFFMWRKPINPTSNGPNQSATTRGEETFLLRIETFFVSWAQTRCTAEMQPPLLSLLLVSKPLAFHILPHPRQHPDTEVWIWTPGWRGESREACGGWRDAVWKQPGEGFGERKRIEAMSEIIIHLSDFLHTWFLPSKRSSLLTVCYWLPCLLCQESWGKSLYKTNLLNLFLFGDLPTVVRGLEVFLTVYQLINMILN